MSTPAIAAQPIPQRNVSIVPQEQRDAFRAELQKRIAERAFQLFEQDGGQHGSQLSHWLQAESELLRRASEIREAGSWSTANATLADSDPQGLEVLVLRDRAIVAGVRSAPNNSSTYLLIKWPVAVDPATAAAYSKGNTLTVTAKHSPSPEEPTAHSEGVPAAPAENTGMGSQTTKSTTAPNLSLIHI